MKILFVHPAAQMSISDVARGYRSALERAGHEVSDYYLGRRMEYHHRALPVEVRDNPAVLSRQASETILNEALYHEVDLVIVISGLNVHPIFLWLLDKVKIPAAVVLTESPYDDEAQAEWVSLTKVGVKANVTVFTNDEFSARQHGWTFLAPSYDPLFHRPIEGNDQDRCEVLMVGTGWSDRQKFLEAVDWSGIDLRLYGIWPGLESQPDSPLHKFYRPLVVDNARVAEMYCSAKICLNFHRRSVTALTPNPRIFELAACGVFQLSDPREGLTAIFGDSVPTFTSPEELRRQIRYYLARPEERTRRADEAFRLVQGHTFENRAAALLATLMAVA